MFSAKPGGSGFLPSRNSFVRSTCSMRVHTRFFSVNRSVDSNKYPLQTICDGRFRLRPYSAVDDHSPCSIGRLYIADAVMRRMSSSVCNASGLVSCPIEYCMLQFFAGFTVNRVDQQSILPWSMFHLFSFGSRPWNPDASMRKYECVRATVMTSDAMCVESCR